MLYILFLTITVDVTECLLPKLKPKDEKCVAKDWLHAECRTGLMSWEWELHGMQFAISSRGLISIGH